MSEIRDPVLQLIEDTDDYEQETEQKTGRFWLDRLVGKIEVEHSALDVLEYNKALSVELLSKEIVEAIKDGREYCVRLSQSTSESGFDFRIITVCDIVLLKKHQVEIGESVHESQISAPSDLARVKCLALNDSGTVFERRPWGWERVK